MKFRIRSLGLIFAVSSVAFGQVNNSSSTKATLTVDDVLACSAVKYNQLSSQKKINADYNFDRKNSGPAFQMSASLTQSDLVSSPYSTGSIAASRNLYDPLLQLEIDSAQKYRESVLNELQGGLLDFLLQSNSQLFTYLTFKSDQKIFEEQLLELEQMKLTVSKLTKLNVIDQSEYLLIEEAYHKLKSLLIKRDFEIGKVVDAIYLASDLKINELSIATPDLSWTEQVFLSQMESHPYAKEFRFEEAALQSDASSKKRSWWPSISATAGGQQILAARDRPNSPFSPYISLSLTVSLNTDLLQAEATRTQLSLQRSKFELSSKLKELQTQIKQIFSEMRNFETQIKVSQGRLKNLEKLHENQLAKFKVGRISFFNLRDTENSLFETKRDLSFLEIQMQRIQSYLGLYQMLMESKKSSSKFKCKKASS